MLKVGKKLLSWKQIKKIMTNPITLQEPNDAIEVMRRCGYVQNGMWPTLQFNYGQLQMKRITTFMMVEYLNQLPYISETPSGLITLNGDPPFTFEPLIYPRKK
jgi:hypothetical protein